MYFILFIQFNSARKKNLRLSVCNIISFPSALPGVHWHATRYGVPDARAGPWISLLHNDKRPFLQGDHSEVLGVIQGLQEKTVTRPGMVTEA